MPVEGVCPNCERPFRGQPNPLHSDMEMRNMPAPGEKDMGGNPLQEGIMADTDGGWQQRRKRDESFASVNRDHISLEPYEDWRYAAEEPEFETQDVIPPGGNTVAVRPMEGMPSAQWHNGNLQPLAQLGVNIDGMGPDEYLRGANEGGLMFHRNDEDREFALSHEDPEVLDLAKRIALRGEVMGDPQLQSELHHQINRHPGTLAVDPNDALHGALGTFDVRVQHPETGDWQSYRDTHEQLRPLLRNPVNIRARDPRLVEGLQNYFAGDPALLREYQAEQQRAASTIKTAGWGPLGDAASWVAGAAKDAGNWAWNHPEVMGLAAGAALAPFTMGASLEGAAALEGADAAATGMGAMDVAKGVGTGAMYGDMAGSGVKGLQGPGAAPAPAGPGVVRGPGALAHTASGSPIHIDQDLSQLDPNGKAANLFIESFPLLLHYATDTQHSSLDHPLLRHLHDEIGRELGAKTAANPFELMKGLIGPAEETAAPQVEKGVANQVRGPVGEWSQVPQDQLQAQSPSLVNRAMSALGKGGTMGGMMLGTGLMGQMAGTGVDPMIGGLMGGAMGRRMGGPMGGFLGWDMGQQYGQQQDQQAQQQYQQQQQSVPLRDPSQLSSVKKSEYEHPSSIPERGVNAESPEDVDPHETNVGDDNPAYDPERGSGVGSYGDPDYEHALTMFGHFLPLVLKYYNSNESGADHPLMRTLDASLERGIPGYSSKLFPVQAYNDDHEMYRPSHTTGTSVPPPGAAPAAPMGQTPQMNPGHIPNVNQQSGAPGTQRQCPQCGANIPADSPTCPQCQASATNIPAPPQMGVQAKTAAGAPVPQPDYSSAKCPHCGATLPPGGAFMCPYCNQPTSPMPVPQAQQPQQAQARTAHQGPHTREQYAAVAEYLESQGRGDEIPLMLQKPWDYADELAELQRKGYTPADDDDQQQQPPQPAMEEAPPEETMPMPGMSAPQGQAMQAAVDRYATPDSFAPRCPKCHSGTTGVMSEDGDCYCHACGNQWKKPVVKDLTTSSWSIKILGDRSPTHDDPNTIGVPVADRERPRDVEREQDSSLSWVDDNNEPLKVGREYEMHSANYDIPDIVRIEAVKPDSIEYTLTGEYGLTHRTEVSREEADIEQLSFTPSDSEFEPDNPQQPEFDQNTMDDYERADPTQTSDLSVPAVKKTKKGAQPPEGTGALGWEGQSGPYGRPSWDPHGLGIDHPDMGPPLDEIPCEACEGQGCKFCKGTGIQPEGEITSPYEQHHGWEAKVAYPEPPPDEESYPSDAPGDVWDEPQQNPVCPACGGPGVPLGQLGAKAHFRCRNCGMDFNHDVIEDHPPGYQNPIDGIVGKKKENTLVDYLQGEEGESYDDEFNHPSIHSRVAGDPLGRGPYDTDENWETHEYNRHQPTQPTLKKKEKMCQCGHPMSDHDPNAGCIGCAKSDADTMPGHAFTPISKIAKPHLEWLNEEAPDTVPVEWEKTAGKNYSPMEQREFIDEQGEARNRDKLNLAGTHYEEDDDDFGNDDLLFL